MYLYNIDKSVNINSRVYLVTQINDAETHSEGKNA